MFMDRLSEIGSKGWGLMLGWTVWIFVLPFALESLAYLIGRGHCNYWFCFDVRKSYLYFKVFIVNYNS
jgi:hypothetical protein